MGYRGLTKEMVMGVRGLNYNPNVSLIPKNALLWPSRNVDLHKGVAETRTGTTKVNATAVSGGPRIMGITDYRLDASTSFQPFATSDGKVWGSPTSSIKSGMSASNHFHFETFDVSGVNKLFITDGSTRPQIWDGSAAATEDLPNIPTDWTGSNFPAQLVRHQQGFASVMVAIGFSTTWKNVYISADDDATDFDDTDVRVFVIDTGDGIGPVAGIDFGERLFVFGKNQSFYLNDQSSDSAEWFFVPAQFAGGVAHARLLVKTDNDLFAMAPDGTIYSVTSAEQFGDYRLANVARPAFIDRWIQENVNMARIEDFHAVYDPTKRCVMWFMVRSGQTEVKCALKQYVDRDPMDAWAYDDQPNSDSGYNASCSAKVQTSTGTFRIYTGDYDGFIWKHGEPDASDNGAPYYSGIHLPYNDFEAANVTKDFPRMWVSGKPQGGYTIPYNWWVDGTRETSGEISIISNGAKFGSAKFGSAKFGGSDYLDIPTELGSNGRRIKVEIYNNTANRKFSIAAVRFDLKPLGAVAQ